MVVTVALVATALVGAMLVGGSAGQPPQPSDDAVASTSSGPGKTTPFEGV
jgi:hypothetical protein